MNVTIHINVNGRDRPVEMPAATTGRFAAKRGAEAWGLDPECPFILVDPVACVAVPDGEIIGPWDGMVLLLAMEN